MTTTRCFEASEGITKGHRPPQSARPASAERPRPHRWPTVTWTWPYLRPSAKHSGHRWRALPCVQCSTWPFASIQKSYLRRKNCVFLPCRWGGNRRREQWHLTGMNYVHRENGSVPGGVCCELYRKRAFAENLWPFAPSMWLSGGGYETRGLVLPTLSSHALGLEDQLIRGDTSWRIGRYR